VAGIAACFSVPAVVGICAFCGVITRRHLRMNH
jgi:hypothetical protein